MKTRYVITVWVCGNEETVCDYRSVGPWQKEATIAACDAAVRAAEDVETPDDCELTAEVDCGFAAWHGGARSRPESGMVSVMAFTENKEGDEEREWIPAREYPEHVRRLARAAIKAADEAANKEICRWEAECAAEAAE